MNSNDYNALDKNDPDGNDAPDHVNVEKPQEEINGCK